MMTPTQIVTLLACRGIGRRTAVKLIDSIQATIDDRDLYELVCEHAERSSRIEQPEPEAFHALCETTTAMMQWCADQGIHVIAASDERYPSRLRSIPDPPPLVYVRGELTSVESQRAVAVIGSRSASAIGLAASRQMAGAVSDAGAAVVSGLALGCDTEAHLGCLDRGGITVAVLGNGLDTVFPAQNRELAERIVESGGCMLSEQPVGARASRGSLVDRDRLQSGLSQAVLLIESAEDGGSMHAMRAAEQQGRQRGVFYPSNEMDELPSASGNRRLLEEIAVTRITSERQLTDWVGGLSDASRDGPSIQAGLFG